MKDEQKWDEIVEYKMEIKTNSGLKNDDALDMKKLFVQCNGGGSISIGVGNQTRKMKNKPRRKRRKKNPLVNSWSTGRKGEDS
uniref:Uncharacterized protein n=1 Tax=Cucumis sativus TaxID=3659 RepID=A0A0A0KVV7_CUCSA